MNTPRLSIGPFPGATDVPLRVRLPAEVDRVSWSIAVASAGEKLTLEVRTRFVGDGAPATLDVVELNGRTVWRGTGEVAAGACLFDVELPQTLDSSCTTLVAMVRMPRHEIDSSCLLQVVPPIRFARAYWNREEALPGDTVRMIAEIQSVPEGAAAIFRVYRAGPDGVEEAVGVPAAALLTGRRFEVSWAVPPADSLRPDVGNGPRGVDLVFRATADGTASSFPSGRLRIALPDSAPAS